MPLRLASVFLTCVAGACATARPDRVAPIPRETPFDSSPRERVEYLHYYRLGYEAALTGCQSSRCTRDDFWPARSAGWVDGQGDGFLVWIADYEDAVARRDRARLQVLLSGLGDFAAEALLESLREPVRR